MSPNVKAKMFATSAAAALVYEGLVHLVSGGQQFSGLRPDVAAAAFIGSLAALCAFGWGAAGIWYYLRGQRPRPATCAFTAVIFMEVISSIQFLLINFDI